MPFFFAWGVVLWFAVTLLVRLIGEQFLIPDQRFPVALAFVLAVPAVWLVTYPFYRWRNVVSAERPVAAVLIVLPGMLLSTFSILIFNDMFPNLVSDTGPSRLAAWLLWAYSLALLTGFFPWRRDQGVSTSLE